MASFFFDGTMQQAIEHEASEYAVTCMTGFLMRAARKRASRTKGARGFALSRADHGDSAECKICNLPFLLVKGEI